MPNQFARDDDNSAFLFTEKGLAIARFRLSEFLRQEASFREQHLLAQLDVINDGIAEQTDLLRRAKFVAERYTALKLAVDNAVIVPPPTDTNYLGVGNVAEIQRYDEDGEEMGPPAFWLVSGYDDSDPHARPWSKLSYTSPMFDEMFDEPADLDREYFIPGTKHTAVLLRIHLPHQLHKLSLVPSSVAA